MKKLLFLVMLTSMFGTAHATRSRMNSLGQPVDQGSFYLMDNRDFFRNPANVGKMRNFMVLETATNYGGVTGNVEGGYFGEFSSDMAFGVYLGKASTVLDIGATYINSISGIPTAANPTPTGGTFLTSAAANPLNLFLGGGSDMKWGINLNYAGTSKDVIGGEQKYSAFGLAAGIETSGGLQVYANWGSQSSEGGFNPTPTNAFTPGKLENDGFGVGVIWGLNAETTIWGQYYGSTYEVKDRTPSVKADITSFVIGIGRIYELSPTARFNFDLSYNSSEADGKSAGKVEKTALPLTIGLEADAAEWLILRGSVNQNFILGDVTNTSATSAGAKETTDASALTGTNVAIGGTLHFGKLKIDGNLGGIGGNSISSLFNSQSFFVNAAVTYMF